MSTQECPVCCKEFGIHEFKGHVSMCLALLDIYGYVQTFKKGDDVWNNNKCPKEIAKVILKQHFDSR